MKAATRPIPARSLPTSWPLRPASVWMTNAEGEKLKGISAGATKTAASETNGHITIDGVDTTVYTEPSDVIHGTVASDSDVTAMLTEVFGA